MCDIIESIFSIIITITIIIEEAQFYLMLANCVKNNHVLGFDSIPHTDSNVSESLPHPPLIRCAFPPPTPFLAH
jgi:hypothetical protein